MLFPDAGLVALTVSVMLSLTWVSAGRHAQWLMPSKEKVRVLVAGLPGGNSSGLRMASYSFS
jgi:hypothetical protein